MHQVTLETGIMEANEQLAAHNREHWDAQGISVINLMSAPGAGKTSVLEQTILRIRDDYRLGVIEGDLMTTMDADRISALDVPAYQITTGTVCHLDARMVHNALDNFDIGGIDLLFIENVGNLVCPAEFNLGEHLKIMVYSVVEGAEKPRKYPVMFHESAVVLLNKIDLLPYSGVSLEELERNVLAVSPEAIVFPVSCRTGEGFDAWTEWLRGWIEARKSTIKRADNAATGG